MVNQEFAIVSSDHGQKRKLFVDRKMQKKSITFLSMIKCSKVSRMSMLVSLVENVPVQVVQAIRLVMK